MLKHRGMVRAKCQIVLCVMSAEFLLFHNLNTLKIPVTAITLERQRLLAYLTKHDAFSISVLLYQIWSGFSRYVLTIDRHGSLTRFRLSGGRFGGSFGDALRPPVEVRRLILGWIKFLLFGVIGKKPLLLFPWYARELLDTFEIMALRRRV